MPIQEIVTIADRSGSMRGKEEDTVGGINSIIDELRKTKTDGDVIRFSLKLFDHEEILLMRGVDLRSVKEFNEKDFIPRGTTALRDAMGNTIKYFMEKKLKDPNLFDSCVIYVATDGYENASKKYSANDLKDLINTAQTTYNIQVLYLGANQDAILEASKIGICADRAMNYCETKDNIEAAYRGVASAATRTRSTNSAISFLHSERQASQACSP